MFDLPKTREESWMFYRDLQSDCLQQSTKAWYQFETQLGRHDLFYLLVRLLRRPDINRDWLFERCREVQASPDGHLDLWFRDGYKDCDCEMPVLTANRGWTTHGKLGPGDFVFAPDGHEVMVMAATEHYQDSTCYKITFSRTGEEIIVGKGHLWRIRRRVKHRIGSYGKLRRNEFIDEIVTTEWLAQHPDVRRDVGVCEPLAYPELDLPIDPYVLGVWIGDGTSSNANITAGDNDAQIMQEMLESCGIQVRQRPKPHCVTLSLGTGIRGKKGSSDITTALRSLGMLNNKHIPDVYMRASIEQRMALLQGLMDTDGSCDPRGKATFVQSKEILAKQVYELVAGLGLRPRIHRYTGKYKDGNTFWQVCFQAHTDRNPFRMPRKAALALAPSYYRGTRTISKVELVPTVPTNCIQVEGNMYCVGKTLIPTHNSSIITFGLTIQDILNDPEITIGIFSHTRPIAKGFLSHIKREMEENEYLKWLYKEILWENPSKEAPKWSEDGGLIVKRKSNPKEATLESHGLVDGQPTSKHFSLRIYDDVVPAIMSPDMVTKTTNAWDMSQNLGTTGGRVRYIGTRYQLGDTYATMIERGAAEPRIHAATHNSRFDGHPVFFTDEEWQKKLRNSSRAIIASQQLQNPMADDDATFRAEWLRPYEVRPRTLNVYIMCDPSRGKYATSDATAIAVIGIAAGGAKYLLDGYCHRMTLSQRWIALRTLYRRWSNAAGVQHIAVGYERYGQQSDDEYFAEQMKLDQRKNIPHPYFPIEELSWPREGGNSKRERVERLEPDFRNSRFFLPSPILHDGKPSVWRPITDPEDKKFGTIEYDDAGGLTKQQNDAINGGSVDLVAKALINRDTSLPGERGGRYDLTNIFIEQFLNFPFGAHDDLIDAASRLYDMDALPPMAPSARQERVQTYVDGV